MARSTVKRINCAHCENHEYLLCNKFGTILKTSLIFYIKEGWIIHLKRLKNSCCPDCNMFKDKNND